MDASKVIKDFLIKNNWTQKTFAFHCKITETSVWNYLNGKPIHPKTAGKIADKTGIAYDKLCDKPRKVKKKKTSS